MPDMSSGTLATMPYGSAVTVTGEAVNGFYAVSYEELSGYASAQYLSFDADEPQTTVQPTKVPEASHPVAGRIGTVTAPSGLNLRADSSEYANVLATLGYGVQVTVTGERVSGFYPVRIGTLSGYVSADYVSFDSESAATAAPTATPAPGTGGYRVVVESDNGLNLRAQPERKQRRALCSALRHGAQRAGRGGERLPPCAVGRIYGLCFRRLRHAVWSAVNIFPRVGCNRSAVLI